MITPFINNKLSNQEMEEFLDHVGSCKSCMEELEFYYALLTAMKQLDEDKNLSNDFRLELSGKIKRAREKVVHVRHTYFRKKAILILFMLLLAFFLGIHYAEKSVEMADVTARDNFRSRMIFQNGKDEYLERLMQQYSKEQGNNEISFPYSE